MFSVIVYENIKNVIVNFQHSIGSARLESFPHLVKINKENLPSFIGDNLDDLYAKMDAWIDEVVEPILEMKAFVKCPLCGYDEETGVDPIRDAALEMLGLLKEVQNFLPRKRDSHPRSKLIEKIDAVLKKLK